MEANISWVTEQVATGGDFAYVDTVRTRQIGDILRQGIDLIIDCRTEHEGSDERLWSEAERVFGSAPEYIHLPTEDAYGHTIPVEHFQHAWEVAVPVLERDGKVFIHCHMGVNRGPSTALYVLIRQGMTPEAAYDAIRRARPQAGLAYALDALDALKEDWDELGTGVAHPYAVRRFKRHINKVFPPSEQAKVNRIMREGHESDQRQRLHGRM